MSENKWKEDALYNALAEYINENDLNINGASLDINPITPEDSGTIKEYMEKLEHYDKKDKINFVLERLKAAGIEVVTDKKEFDRILEREKLLQKMAIDFSEFEKLEELINNQKSSNLHLQNEKFDLESQKKIIQQKNHTKFVEVVKQLEKYIPTNEKYIDNFGHLRSFSKVLINNTEPENDDRKNIFLIKVNNPHQNDIFVVTRDSKNRCEITKNGIIAIIRKDFDDRNENWILTGFQYKGEKEEKNREATEAIQTVIAQYSHSLEYSYFRNQVGAVISSLDLNISQSSKKSSLQSIVQNGKKLPESFLNRLKRLNRI